MQKVATSPRVSGELDKMMERIEMVNPGLKGVLLKEFTRINLPNDVITELINIISEIDFGKNISEEQDTLGEVYEYFLGEFAREEGKGGGEFYTPSSLVDLLVEVLQPSKTATIFDPACGSGGMFVRSHKFVKARHKSAGKVQYYGQESNEQTYKLARMNLALRGMDGGNIRCGNSYTDDKFADKRFDIVLANPPFNDSKGWKIDLIANNDPRLEYGKPPKRKRQLLLDTALHNPHERKRQGGLRYGEWRTVSREQRGENTGAYHRG